MTEPLSEHCLCDKCGSDECKAGEDNLEFLARKDEREKMLAEIVDLLKGRLEGWKILLDTPEKERWNTYKELKMVFDEVRLNMDCIKILCQRKKE